MQNILCHNITTVSCMKYNNMKYMHF